jgi:UDP-N-acetylglucosamine acyltransferase
MSYGPRCVGESQFALDLGEGLASAASSRGKFVASIHPTAQVEGTVAADVIVGPFCVVGPQVVLSRGVRLHENIILKGDTEIGERTEIFPFASIGQSAQITGYTGRPGKLRIGAGCVLREYVTINVGSEKGDLVTEIGDDCFLMMGTHVAHDCKVGRNVVMVNYSGLAGHCVIGDFVIISGHNAVHQFVRIGESAYVGALSGVENDIIPFGMAIGNRARLKGLNIVGLKRRRIEKSRIHELRDAYRGLFTEAGTLRGRLDGVLAAHGHEPLVRTVVDFIRTGGGRAMCVPEHEVRAAAE